MGNTSQGDCMEKIFPSKRRIGGDSLPLKLHFSLILG